MDRFLRFLYLLAATAIVVAALTGSAPAYAAEETVSAPNISAKASAAQIRRHRPIGRSHAVRVIKPAASNYGCCGVWCGRQFVLMIGIGY
jgi:hypothetical protein